MDVLERLPVLEAQAGQDGRDLRRPAAPQPAPIFIVGCERSGTTLLRFMINAHPDVAIPPESYFIHDLWGAYPSTASYTPGARARVLRLLFEGPRRVVLTGWGLDPAPIRQALEQPGPLTHADVLDIVFSAYARQRGKARWGDKTPAYTEFLPVLAAIFPRATFVHLIRDGRAVCESLSRQRFGPRTMAGRARLWSQRVSRGRRAGRRLGPPGRYMELWYWQLVRQPEATLRRICDSVGLAFDPIMLRHYEVPALTWISPAEGRHRHAFSPVTGELVEYWKTQLEISDRRLIEVIA